MTCWTFIRARVPREPDTRVTLQPGSLIQDAVGADGGPNEGSENRANGAPVRCVSMNLGGWGLGKRCVCGGA